MAVLASDSFTRADAATLGANYTQMKGVADSLGIFSNQADAASVNRCGNYYSAISWPNDQYSQAKLVSVANSTDTAVSVRAITTGAARNAYHGGHAHSETGANTPAIWKQVANVLTVLSSGGSALVGGETIYLEVQGTALVLKVNGSTVTSTTDASLASGSAGLYEENRAGNIAVLDDWVGGDFATGTTRGTPFETRGTAFNGGRTFTGILRCVAAVVNLALGSVKRAFSAHAVEVSNC